MPPRPYVRPFDGHDPFRPQRPAPSLPPPEPLEGRRPRILAHVLRAFPMHFAGAERMLHNVLDGLVERGWDASIVAVEHKGDPYEWNGIPVQRLVDAQMGEPYAWCDVALTHLDVTSHATAWARYGRPLLHLVHNHRQLTHHRVLGDGFNYPIWNSEWIRDEWSAWQGRSIVVRPPVRASEHATTVKNRHKLRTVTLVNLLGEKGGPLFWRLARRLPDWRFQGVDGAYGMQHHPEPMPANGVVVPNGTDMRAVWKQTGVLVAPSWYESWGLAAVEAVASGIPVIAHGTPGLTESMTSPEHGACAMFADRDDDQAWVDALTRLEDPAEYRAWSDRALLRSGELDAQSVDDLDRLDVWLRDLVGRWQALRSVPEESTVPS